MYYRLVPKSAANPQGIQLLGRTPDEVLSKLARPFVIDIIESYLTFEGRYDLLGSMDLEELSEKDYVRYARLALRDVKEHSMTSDRAEPRGYVYVDWVDEPDPLDVALRGLAKAVDDPPAKKAPAKKKPARKAAPKKKTGTAAKPADAPARTSSRNGTSFDVTDGSKTYGTFSSQTKAEALKRDLKAEGVKARVRAVYVTPGSATRRRRAWPSVTS